MKSKKNIKKPSAAPEYKVQFDIEENMNQRYNSMLKSMNVTVLFNISKALKNQAHGL